MCRLISFFSQLIVERTSPSDAEEEESIFLRCASVRLVRFFFLYVDPGLIGEMTKKFHSLVWGGGGCSREMLGAALSY